VTIVFQPSSVLINNHKEFLDSLNIRAEIIDGNVSYEERDDIRAEIEEADSQIRFLFVTPEVVNKNFIMREFLENILTEGEIVNYVVVDEAHKLIDSTYRESYELLGELRMMNEDIPWIALTSTNLENSIAQKLNMKDPLYLSSPMTRENIFYDVVMDGTKEGQKVEDFINRLKVRGEVPSGIIYCNLSRQIPTTISYLKSVGIEAGAYHRNVGDKFENWANGDFPVLVTTGESLGFGVNFNMPAIRFVIHLYMPSNLRSFYHVS
jgi:bloom syndrome protein